MNNDIDFYANILRNDLASFVKKSFYYLEQKELKWGWHLDLICEYAMAVEKKRIKRLIINMPPRNLKSITLNVAFPAWCWTRDPSKKLMAASYKMDLSIKHNVDTRRLINSEWYQSMFGLQLAGDQNTKTKIETTNRGSKECGTMKSPPTGSGANIIIIDDPHNTVESESEVERKKVCEGFGANFTTRLDNKKEDGIILIMQRLHEEDLTGSFLQQGGWVHLCFPVVAEEDLIYYYPNSDKIFHIFKKGELLNEGLENMEVINNMKKQLGSYAFAGQYMQTPSIKGGGVFKEKWWKRWSILPELAYREIFVDTAQKTGEENDYTVFQCWGMGKDGNAYLIDQMRGKWEAPDLIKMAVIFWNKHKNANTGVLRRMVVEDKSSGTGLIQTLKQHKIPIGEVTPDKDKLTRAMGVVPCIESGYIFIPENADWVQDYLYEFNLFPKGSHDDQIDPTVYCIHRFFVNKEVATRFMGVV